MTHASRDTQTGARFETITDIPEMFRKARYKLTGNKASKGKHTVEFYSKTGFYKWLEAEHDINWRERISSQLLPDEAVYCRKVNTLTIVEKKFQNTHGSADEKLQTATFKLRQYEKLVAGTGIKVQYFFLLNDWFAKDKYVDVLDFIETEGHRYFINSIPVVHFK